MKASDGENSRHRISSGLKKKILIKQRFRCIYCKRKFGSYIKNKKTGRYIYLKIHFDHFVPWNYFQNYRSENIKASCQICNLIKGHSLFFSLNYARIYILKRREKLGYCDPSYKISWFRSHQKTKIKKIKIKGISNEHWREAYCFYCNKHYEKKSRRQIFCSDDCRQTAFILKNASPKLLDKIKKGIK